MVHHDHGVHHFHSRKRVHQNLEKYPHPHKWKNLMDRLIYFIGIVGPIMTIPQIYKIFAEQNAAGVSLISWSTYAITGFFWLVYAIMHKEKPLIFTYCLWIIVDLLIVLGVILYG